MLSKLSVLATVTAGSKADGGRLVLGNDRNVSRSGGVDVLVGDCLTPGLTSHELAAPDSSNFPKTTPRVAGRFA